MTKPDKKEEEKSLSEDKSKTHKAESKEKNDSPKKEEAIEVPVEWID